jgi:hypothetical protein
MIPQAIELAKSLASAPKKNPGGLVLVLVGLGLLGGGEKLQAVTGLELWGTLVMGAGAGLTLLGGWWAKRTPPADPPQ